MGFAIGVDLGGTNLRIAAIDEHGRVLEQGATATQVKLGRDAVIIEMGAAVEQVSAKLKGSSELMGVGIGVPGIIDQRTGMLRESPNLPGGDDYPVRNEIETRLQTTVVLENDANAAAVGEAWLGAARGVDSACVLALGTGVGGGIVQDGRVWHGMSGMAGEVGHITVDPNGPRCNCGNRGCCEVFASATAIVRMAHEAIARGTASELARMAESPDVEFSAKAFHQFAMQGDKTAPALFNELAERSMVYAATAPDQDAAGNAGVSGVRKHTVVTRALLGSDAGLYGAARLPMTVNRAVAIDAAFAAVGVR